jgi:predicted RNase H-like HicB family nuclease
MYTAEASDGAPIYCNLRKGREGGYHVFCPTLPGCHTQSETIDEGIQNIREAIQLYVESLVEDGLAIPPAVTS